jgi:hypothetical protein
LPHAPFTNGAHTRASLAPHPGHRVRNHWRPDEYSFRPSPSTITLCGYPGKGPLSVETGIRQWQRPAYSRRTTTAERPALCRSRMERIPACLLHESRARIHAHRQTLRS